MDGRQGVGNGDSSWQRGGSGTAVPSPRQSGYHPCMSADRNKPGRLFWSTAALIALPVLYVLTFGPAGWLAERNWNYVPIITRIYRPLMQVAYRGPDWIKHPLRWWAADPSRA